MPCSSRSLILLSSHKIFRTLKFHSRGHQLSRCNCLCQAIWRQVQHLGLSQLYTTDQAMRQEVRNLMALGFLKPEDVLPTFNLLKAAASPILHGLFHYFEQQWLGNVSLLMWNVWYVDVRTNNSCEGWHSRFNRIVNKHHPNTWYLMRCFQEEQASTDVTRCQIAAGQSNAVRVTQKYKLLQKRVETLKGLYNAGTMNTLEYLRGISHNLGGQ